MGCTSSSTIAAEGDAKTGSMTMRKDSESASVGRSAADENPGEVKGKDSRRRRLSMTGGPMGSKVLSQTDDARRRRLSVVVQPKGATEQVAIANRRASIAEEEAAAGPLEGTPADSLPLTWGYYSRPGNDPCKKIKENQDSWVLQDSFAGSDKQMFFGVYDGHGPNGRFASQYVRDHLPEAVNTSTLASDPYLTISNACLATNQNLNLSSSVDVYVSGSTGISAFLRENHLFVANVGDSRAVLGRKSKRGGGIKALDLSSDQKPDRPDEMARIIASGGRVFDWGVSRVWLQDMEIPGLAMARSFGDVAAESVGVFAEPELSEVRLSAVDQFVILASDGVFEFISSQEAVDIVAKHMETGPQAACEALVKESTARWNAEEDVVDDTTCIILFLNFP